ncbi:O-antigen ligase family protein [Devosia ginsengisoli]|uniref:O-antigen ligase family protein n=1 Tax=Devosia ginsengisoli TaxID=400770 RepID=A0A5B8LRE3_9HYPH|nr:hypothetical protein [Devosia ginsengisoli]QDZ10713.1 hypothetical protein FPZ08_08075 [Devosia ginsengisoli]
MKLPAPAPFLLVVLLAITPIQWIRIVESSIGFIGYFHIVAILLIASTILIQELRQSSIRIVRASPHIWVGFGFLMLMTALSLLKPLQMLPASDLARQIFYAASGLASGTVFFGLLRRSRTEILMWSAPATLTIFLTFLAVSLPHVNIFALVGQAVMQANPDIVVFQLFRAAFQSGTFEDGDVRSNLRHGIMAALLLSAMVSLFALPRQRSRLTTAIVVASVIITLLIVTLSMSRSSWLVMGMIGLLFGFAVVIRSAKWMSYVAIGIPILAAILLFLGATTPILALFMARLTSSGSYEGRAEISFFNLDAISEDIFFGAHVIRESGSPWAHNLFIDYWAAAGILGLCAAMLFGGAVILLWFRQGFVLVGRPENRMLHFYCAAFLCFPIARFITAPKGHLFLTQWQATGFALAIVAFLAWKRHTANAPKSPTRPHIPLDRAQPAVAPPQRVDVNRAVSE